MSIQESIKALSKHLKSLGRRRGIIYNHTAALYAPYNRDDKKNVIAVPDVLISNIFLALKDTPFTEILIDQKAALIKNETEGQFELNAIRFEHGYSWALQRYTQRTRTFEEIHNAIENQKIKQENTGHNTFHNMEVLQNVKGVYRTQIKRALRRASLEGDLEHIKAGDLEMLLSQKLKVAWRLDPMEDKNSSEILERPVRDLPAKIDFKEKLNSLKEGLTTDRKFYNTGGGWNICPEGFYFKFQTVKNLPLRMSRELNEFETSILEKCQRVFGNLQGIVSVGPNCAYYLGKHPLHAQVIGKIKNQDQEIFGATVNKDFVSDLSHGNFVSAGRNAMAEMSEIYAIEATSIFESRHFSLRKMISNGWRPNRCVMMVDAGDYKLLRCKEGRNWRVSS